MEAIEEYPMNGGHGIYSYAKNSYRQVQHKLVVEIEAKLAIYKQIIIVTLSFLTCRDKL